MGGGRARDRGMRETMVAVAAAAAAARESPCGVVVRRRLLCLRNPFRESAERGTQTSEWGKNSVSLPVLHPFSLTLPLHSPPYYLSRFSSSFSRALHLPPPVLGFSLFLPVTRYVSLVNHPSLASSRAHLSYRPLARSLASLSWLRDNQAEHKLGRRLARQVIFTNHETTDGKR